MICHVIARRHDVAICLSLAYIKNSECFFALVIEVSSFFEVREKDITKNLCS